MIFFSLFNKHTSTEKSCNGSEMNRALLSGSTEGTRSKESSEVLSRSPVSARSHACCYFDSTANAIFFLGNIAFIILNLAVFKCSERMRSDAVFLL